MIRLCRLAFAASRPILAVVCGLLLGGCGSGVVHEVKLDAMRVLDGDADPVTMSLWIYDSKGDVIRRTFTPGRLDSKVFGTSWVPVNDPDFGPIPKESIPDASRFSCQIKLNPNRLLTPPDAVFNLALDLEGGLKSEDGAVEVVVESEDEGRYQIKLRLRRRQVDNQPQG